MGRSRRRKQRGRMVFMGRNYRLLIVSILLILVGFTAMRVENAVDGFVSLYVSPILLFLGYLGVICAILWKSDTRTESAANASS